MLIALHHAAWRVIEVRDRPEDLWDDRDRQVVAFRPRAVPVSIVLRPWQITSTDVRAHRHNRHKAAWIGATWWDVYPDEHFPVCATCTEPLPCRHLVTERAVAAEMKKVDRFGTAGVCPSCAEPVSHRQKRIRFTENLVAPFGPPVTFHLRGQCFNDALRYERRWHDEEPDTRPLTLSCPGTEVRHRDGGHQCSRGDQCPGPQALHDGMTRCGCQPGACASPVFGGAA